MSDVREARPWFRPKIIGPGWTPVTWQGWLITLVFCVVIAATVQMIMPQNIGLSAAWPWVVAVRRDLGVPDVGLGPVGGVASVGLEIAFFLVVAWWTSRSAKPLD
jgi:hypothetical protein